MARDDDDEDDINEKTSPDDDNDADSSAEDEDRDSGTTDDEDSGTSETPSASGVSGTGSGTTAPVNREELAAWLTSKYGDQTQTPAAQVAALQDGYGQAADNSGVKAAQDDARFGNNVANFGRALESLARSNSMAHGGEGVDDKFYQGMAAQGAQGVQFAQANRQAKIQQFLQENALKQQVAQSMMLRGSIEDKKKAREWLQDYDERKLKLEGKKIDAISQSKADTDANRLEIAGLKADNRVANADKIVGDKLHTANIKRWDAVDNTLLTGGRNAIDFKKQQGTVTSADKILVVKGQMDTQKGGLDNRQMEEIAIASANLLSNGSGAAMATIQSLVPHSVGGDAAKIKEWLTADPTGTDQQKFVERMFDTADREKHLASEKIRAFRADALANASDLQKDDPKKYKNRLNRYLPGAQYDENGNYVIQPFVRSKPSGVAGGGNQKPGGGYQVGQMIKVQGRPAKVTGPDEFEFLDNQVGSQ